ncbi:bifunctional 4-hydroxy-2-oxoglutarate aldolase/2-dehydro-3-deoxy-phosphogluconate aldolase [Natrinema halophilum]|uniref:Bifunctional 4-hydroxy-2-oxoglutarate aldolase/2-dehydro-3-deoxy-phosphogluconate aldolase n=1 Tax=Natrinema halophilum TaxID=1699371 RepID=A0A7D5GRP5_9EURY|nr:bifunctional 4-hydroxy-2-oxoglutarate aldolase/2-dehydro-3-deoxy-phosphogluconate aldolase [Natrinema halophilum]QLG48166.1 bifunctional 4-hydroxy-2-oxoglutarate aldolase/2-dehydro-3-deoxy-phosphogluconate aldolase [Natrinema halophilum]
MPEKHVLRERIVESGVIAVLRGVSEERIVPVARAIHDAGVDALEITADGTHTAEKISAVDRELTDTDAIVGAGTVLDAPTAESVIDAGASFVVSPHTETDVVRICNRNGVLVAPGVMTPTEAVTAMEAGADLLKMFPASTVGPDHIGALSGPLGDVDIVPTGGISPDNVAAFFDAGAVAVGAGGAIVDDEAIAAGDFDRIRENAASFLEAVEAAREK